MCVLMGVSVTCHGLFWMPEKLQQAQQTKPLARTLLTFESDSASVDLKESLALAGVAPLAGASSREPKGYQLIPSQGSRLGFRFHPWSGRTGGGARIIH